MAAHELGTRLTDPVAHAVGAERPVTVDLQNRAGRAGRAERISPTDVS